MSTPADVMHLPLLDLVKRLSDPNVPYDQAMHAIEHRLMLLRGRIERIGEMSDPPLNRNALYSQQRALELLDGNR